MAISLPFPLVSGPTLIGPAVAPGAFLIARNVFDETGRSRHSTSTSSHFKQRAQPPTITRFRFMNDAASAPDRNAATVPFSGQTIRNPGQ